MSKPTTPTSRNRIASSAISIERAACRIAVSSAPTRIRCPSAAARAEPSANPASTASTTWSRLRPLLDVLLRARTAPRRRPRRPRPGPRRTRAATRCSAAAVCMTADGVRERLQVALQRAGVGGVREPGAELGGVGAGQSRSRSRRPGRRRRRPQPAVEVVVEQHLRGLDDVLVPDSCDHAQTLVSGLGGPVRDRPGVTAASRTPGSTVEKRITSRPSARPWRRGSPPSPGGRHESER